MHHLHENMLPCYHDSLHKVLAHLRNNDLQIATRIFLRQGYFLEEHCLYLNCFFSILKVETAQHLLAETFLFLIMSLVIW